MFKAQPEFFQMDNGKSINREYSIAVKVGKRVVIYCEYPRQLPVAITFHIEPNEKLGRYGYYNISKRESATGTASAEKLFDAVLCLPGAELL